MEIMYKGAEGKQVCEPVTTSTIWAKLYELQQSNTTYSVIMDIKELKGRDVREVTECYYEEIEK